MSANDGNRPKGPKEISRRLVIEQLKRPPHCVQVGNINPVRKRLQELMEAHGQGNSRIAGKQIGIQSHSSKCDRGSAESREAKHQENVPPELMDLLFGKPEGLEEQQLLAPAVIGPSPPYLIPSNPDAKMTPEEYEKFMKENWPGLGSTLSLHKKYFRKYIYPMIAKHMLSRDKRLNEEGRAKIEDAVNGRLEEVNKDGKTIGDIVREEVEKHLSNSKEDGKIKAAYNIDADAAVHIVDVYFTNLLEKKFGIWLGGSREYSAQEMVYAVNAIPLNRFDDLTPSGISVSEVLIRIRSLTKQDDVKKAIDKKLHE